MPYVKIRGFAPDAERVTPGIILEGENLVPTLRGMAGAPTPVNSDLPELTATAVGAMSLVQLDGSVRTFAGTPTQIYEAGAQTWADRTRTAGGTYTAGATWRFAQLGNDSFATNDAAVPQVSTSGRFDDLSGAPVCAVLVAVNQQLFALNTNEATFGDSPDRWWVSAFGDAASWSPSIATQAASGRLVTTPGGITGGARLFNNIVVYKEKSFYLGSYVGTPEIWRFDLISDEIGAVSHEAIVPLESVHVFVGIDDFYLFDGSRPQSIGGDIREFFFNDELDADNRSKIRATFNRELARVAIAYPSRGGTGSLDKLIFYHLRSQRWGTPVPLNVRLLFEFIRPTGPTYDTLGDFFATYDDMPVISYNNTFWSSKVTRPAIFNTSDRLQTLDGEAPTSEMTLWDMGQEDAQSFLFRTRPRFAVYPDTGRQVNFFAQNQGQTFTRDRPTATLTDGKFDFERSARWHRLQWRFTGDVEVIGVSLQGQEDGDE